MSFLSLTGEKYSGQLPGWINEDVCEDHLMVIAVVVTQNT